MDFLAFILGALVICGIPAVVSYAFAKRAGGWPVVAGSALFAGVAAVTLVSMQNASGYDGMGLAILLIFGVAPAGAGYLLGGLIGWLRGRPAAA